MRRALMLSVLAFAACWNGVQRTPPHAQPPHSITATPETADPLSATPPPTTSTTTPTAVCRKDDDCALTNVPIGDCCPRLCTPRVVTVDEARRLEGRVRQCERDHQPCALPNCRARSYAPACEGGACVARPLDTR